MSNNYTQFSESLEIDNRDHQAWLEAALTAITEVDEASDIVAGGLLTEEDAEALREILQQETGGERAELSYEPTTAAGGIIFFSEEGGDLSAIAELVRLFLQRFKLDTVWSCQFAETCSKPLAGAFGGGAFVVSRLGVEWMYTNDWVAEAEERMTAYLNTHGDK